MGTALLEQCADVMAHDELEWAVPAAEPLPRELWGALGAMRSVLLVAAAVSGRPDVGLMMTVAILVSFRIEELVTRRFVLAGGAHEVVLIEAQLRWFRERPGEIVGRFLPETVGRTTMGMVSDRWVVDDQPLQIARRHRSTIEAWLAHRAE